MEAAAIMKGKVDTSRETSQARGASQKIDRKLVDIVQGYSKILPDLLGKLAEHKLGILTASAKQSVEPKKHKMNLRKRKPQGSTSEYKEDYPLRRGLFFHPKSLEEEMKHIGFDLDKDPKDSIMEDLDPYVLEDSGEESVDLTELDNESFSSGDKVKLHYFNRIVANGRIISISGIQARVLIEELHMDIGKRFKRPLPFGQDAHWMRKTKDGFKFTTKEIIWSLVDVEKCK